MELSRVHWAGDSRHWVAIVTDVSANKTQAVLYDGDPSHEPRTLPATPSERISYSFLGWSDGQSIVLNDHLLAWDPRGDKPLKSTVDILEIGIGGHNAVKSRSIPLQSNAILIRGVISPQGDRIAWQQMREEIPEWIRILRDRFPRIQVHGTEHESLWVSRVDGTEKHEIGGQDHKANDQSGPLLSDLQWVPGSKRLGFYYGTGCYTVSAE